jgi:biotin transporter BioY
MLTVVIGASSAGFLFGFILMALLADKAICETVQRHGRVVMFGGLRIVGHVEQKIKGYSDKWEKVGSE